MFYVRTSMTEKFQPRVFDPLDSGHPLIAGHIICMACGLPFEVGDRTTLVPLGPGDDTEAQSRAMHGNAFNAVALPVHAACGGLQEDQPMPEPDGNYKGVRPTTADVDQPVHYEEGAMG